MIVQVQTGERTRMTIGIRTSWPHPGDSATQPVEFLGDRLAEATGLENACETALQFALQAANRPGGVLLVQTLAEASPFLIVRHNLPVAWTQAVDDPASPLRRLAQRVVETGQPADPDPLISVAAAIPLSVNSNLQGVLIIQGEACTASAEIEMLAQLARPMARAICASRLHPPLHTTYQELEALQAVIAILSFSSEIEDTQYQMVQSICRILDAELGALILIDEDHPELVTKKTLTGDARWVYQVNPRADKGMVADCLDSGQMLRFNESEADRRLEFSIDAEAGIAVRSALCAPLQARGETLGAIQVFNKRGGSFSNYDQDLLAMIASLSAHALQGTRLIQQLKVANADLEASHWELLRSRNTLRALFDSMPAAFYIVDRKYKLMAINLSCAQRTGKPPKHLVGRQCYEALYQRSEPCPSCRISETLYTGQSTTRNERRWGQEEDPTEWEISTYPIFDETEQVVQAILLEQDVTEKRRLEGIIAQSEKLAAVGQLAAGVAHEINNPLTAIIANAQILQRELPLDDEMQESVDLIARAGARASQVVRNLLDLARKEQYNLADTDVNETIQRALDLVQHELVSRSIDLTFEPGADLPLVKASHDHLQGVWLNLLLNAIDAMDGAPGRIQVTTRRVGSEIRATVADSGKGMPPERISRIFEPFYTTKAPGRGTGLGLSVVHRTVKQHGGHILVDSKLGTGTEFTVVLPVG